MEGLKGILRCQEDRISAIILEPDEWEKDDETILSGDERLIRKVNPHVGITVQPDFYAREIATSRLDPEKRKETVTKLFNCFRSERVTEWITADEIRRLQVPTRIDDLTAEGGWRVFCGMDFSLGDDLHAVSYFCVNVSSGEFFADMDAWMTEDAISKSTISQLLGVWVEQGWLHVSPGSVLEPELPLNRIMQLADHVTFMRWGFDPYKSRQPINTLRAWLYSLNCDPDAYVIPVRQNFGTYNSAVIDFEYAIRTDPPMLHFSPTPLWPWEFSNCVLAESSDGMENHKPVKANSSSGCKIDNVQALLSGLLLYNMMDGQKTPDDI